MRQVYDSCYTNLRPSAYYDVIQDLNVNEYLIYWILHQGVAGQGRVESIEVLCSV